MLRKLRLKFVAICMALVTAVMAVVFFSVYISMERNVEDLSRQVLHRVVQETPMVGSGILRPEIRIGGEQVLLPYFTVEVWGYDSEAEDNNVEVYISFLRKKLEHLRSGVKIRTIRKAGYTLEPPSL